LSGIIGGLVLTVLAILVVVLWRRNKPNSGNLRGCPGGKNGSDIVVISKDINKGGGVDGVSNNSSDMKVEVRTSSSLSNGEDCWEGSDDSGQHFGNGTGHQSKQVVVPKSVDFTDHHGNGPNTHLMAATLPPYNKAEAVSTFDDSP
jgi:hypothetical protein